MPTKVKVEKTVIGNLEVVGRPEMLEQCHGILSLDWEGNVGRVLFKVPADKGWYEPIDKGGIPLYGFDEYGQVICCMVLLKKGEQDHKGNKYNTDVILVASAERTDSWGWDIIKRTK